MEDDIEQTIANHEKAEEKLAVALSETIVVGAMTLIFIIALVLSEWLIAAIAAFFAILCGILVYHEVTSYAQDDD